MRLQYIAGLGLNSMAFQKIYQDILSRRNFPEGLIHGHRATHGCVAYNTCHKTARACAVTPLDTCQTE